MKIELIGKVRYAESNLYKITYDKPTKYVCERCRDKRGKISFIEVNKKVKEPKPGDGIGWCKECTYSIDIGEDTPEKFFSKGQTVYYEGTGDPTPKIYCEFLFAFSDKYAVIKMKDGSQLTMAFEKIFPKKTESGGVVR